MQRFRHIAGNSIIPAGCDLIAFSKIRWDFVWQRPQHLMSRWAKKHRVFFVEEPVYDASGNAFLEIDQIEDRLFIVVPHTVPESCAKDLSRLMDEMLRTCRIHQYNILYITPKALAYTRHLSPDLVIYDCMDELSAFDGAPDGLKELESELMRRADLVFTGGQSLYEARRNSHCNIHPFPGSIDVEQTSWDLTWNRMYRLAEVTWKSLTEVIYNPDHVSYDEEEETVGVSV